MELRATVVFDISPLEIFVELIPEYADNKWRH
jgi:hypothetical protein